MIAEGFASNDLVVLHNGSIYVTDPQSKQIWHIDPATHQSKPVDTFDGCNGITVSPDQTLLYVAHFPGRFIYSYQIAADGRLNYKQPYFHLHLPPMGTESHADGMCTSAEGWLLSATESGIQICDQPGRVNLIVPKPGSRPPRLLRATAPEHALCRHGRRGLETHRATDGRQALRSTCFAAQTEAVTGENRPESRWPLGFHRDCVPFSEWFGNELKEQVEVRIKADLLQLAPRGAGTTASAIVVVSNRFFFNFVLRRIKRRRRRLHSRLVFRYALSKTGPARAVPSPLSRISSSSDKYCRKTAGIVLPGATFHKLTVDTARMM